MEHSSKATILPILLLSDKIIISLSHEDQTLWPVYITIGNLDTKTWRSQTRPGTLLLDTIHIVHEQSEDGDNKDKDLKAKIYHLVLQTMLHFKYPSSTCKWLCTNNILDIALQETYKEGIEIRCADGLSDAAILYLRPWWLITRNRFLSQVLKPICNALFAMFHQKKEK